MTSNHGMRAGVKLQFAMVLGMGAMLSGCLQTAPVAPTPQEQAGRAIYNCPGGRKLDVTRTTDDRSVLLVVDGNTLRLDRDMGYKKADRYTNRLQTLTIFNDGASYEVIGRTTYGPCVFEGGDDGRRRGRRPSRDSDD